MAAPFNSRELVEDFLRLRLCHEGLDGRVALRLTRPAQAMASQRAATSDNLEPDPSLALPPLQVVLSCACNRLSQRYRGNLAAHVSALLREDARGAPMSQALRAVREELFRGGVNWGRIVAMMELGGALCAEAARRGGATQVNEVARWMEEGLDLLRGWIEQNGGWDAFMELYGESRSTMSIWPLRTVFGLAVLGAAGILLAALFSHR